VKCPSCGKAGLRFVRGLCYICYQAEYQKEDRPKKVKLKVERLVKPSYVPKKLQNLSAEQIVRDWDDIWAQL
jgi:NMD protein affecting ribosome stability and mRNA decay